MADRKRFASSGFGIVGFALSWIAIRTDRPADVHDKLGLSETGESGHFDDFEMAGRMLPTGWYLVMARRCEHPISHRVLSELSVGTSVVACSVEEHVMFAAAELWKDAQQVWSIEHQGDDLDAKGTLPAHFEEVKTRYLALHSAERGADLRVDYIFEIPLEIARSIVGFRHDAGDPAVDVFQALKERRAGRVEQGGLPGRLRAPWWKFW